MAERQLYSLFLPSHEGLRFIQRERETGEIFLGLQSESAARRCFLPAKSPLSSQRCLKLLYTPRWKSSSPSYMNATLKVLARMPSNFNPAGHIMSSGFLDWGAGRINQYEPSKIPKYGVCCIYMPCSFSSR